MNWSNRICILYCLLFLGIAGNCQTAGFSLVIKDNTGHISDLRKKAIDFFGSRSVRSDVGYRLAGEGECGIWDEKLADHFKKKYPAFTHIVRLSFDPATKEIDADAIKLTFSICSLRSRRDFVDVDVLYIYNDENITEAVFPLIMGHIGDILIGGGQKQRNLYIKANKELIDNCGNFREILVKLFSSAELYKSFCLIGDSMVHRTQIIGTSEKKANRDGVRVTYRNPGGSTQSSFAADCNCNMQAIERDFIDFVRKITKL